MNPRLIMDNLPEHQCITCKFISKCRRAKTVHQQLSDIEADALEKWKLDVNVSYMIRECDMYSVNWELIQAMQEGLIEFVDDDDSEGEE